MSDTSAILTAEKVGFAYNSEPVIRDASFTIPKGAFVLVKGPSGGGKSTLLRLLGRFEAIGAGVLRLSGTDYADIPPRDFRLRVGYMHQKPVIAPGTVRDNLALAFAFRDDASMPSDGALSDALERLNLSDVSLSQSAVELSVGQQQRVAFLRLMLFDSDVLLLDEPLASLDGDAAQRAMDWLKELHSQGKTVLLSSHGNHAPDDAAMPILRIANGGVQYDANGSES